MRSWRHHAVQSIWLLIWTVISLSSDESSGLLHPEDYQEYHWKSDDLLVAVSIPAQGLQSLGLQSLVARNATLWLRCTRKPSFPVPSVSRRTHCCVKWNCRDFHTSNLHCNSMPRHSIHRSVGCTYGFKPRELNLDLDRWGIRYRRDFTFQYLRTTISVHLPCSLNKKQAFSPRMPIRTSKLKQKRRIIWLRWYRQRFSRIGVSSQCVTKRVTVLLKNRRLSHRKL